jgi:Holliday junction resolvase-like predicted endonuclease
VSNYSVGHEAERQAAAYLTEHGYYVRQLNWKTRLCEIDVVAEKDGCIYFVEVKYRKNNHQGYGVDYITSKKLKQMRFAADMWVHESGWTGDYQLAVISIDAGEITFLDSPDV